MFHFRRIVLGLSMLAASLVCAETWTDPNGVELEYEEYEDGVEITYCSLPDRFTEWDGSEGVVRCSLPDGFGFGIVIPNKLGTRPVRRIGDGAFEGCGGLVSVTIPSGVTSIGYSAFGGCARLKSLTIPKGVTSIESSAFEGCSELTSVTIPSGVTEIEQGTFSGCRGLTSITIPSSVTCIGDWAFKDCTGLTSLTIPKCVTSIGRSAFEGCIGLKTVSIPSGVTSIGDYAFWGCSGLRAVTIPASVTEIGDSAFSDCCGLTSFTVATGNPHYMSVNGLLLSKDGRTLVGGINGHVTIPNGVTRILSGAFYGCGGLKSVTIPASVRSIEYSAFFGCSGLTSVVIPVGVTSIEKNTFYGCHSLTSVVIPDGVTNIGDSAFTSCSGLKSVTLPESMTDIGDNAFNSCSGLTSVAIPANVTNIGDEAFSNCGGLTSFTVAEANPNYTSVNGLLLSKDGRALLFGVTGKVTIPNGVTSIGRSAFSGRVTLTAVTIPMGVTSIGDYAFRWCRRLTSVAIPDGVENIGAYAFCGCSGLKSVTMPMGVTDIGDLAFSGCSGLTEMAIPESVRNIGSSAFSGCSGLTSVTVPAGVSNLGDMAFRGCSGLIAATILADVTCIGRRTFADCKRMESVMIPDGVRSIGDRAFEDCHRLTSITIPESVESIGSSAFAGCRGLTSVTVPKSVADIGNQVFRGCSGLTSLSISEGVTRIGSYAFYGCGGLMSVSIPSSVTRIDVSAFSGCSGLMSFIVAENNPNYKSVNGLLLSKDGRTVVGGINGQVMIPNGVARIGLYAFLGRRRLTSVTIPASVTGVGYAFHDCSGLTSFVVAEDNPSYKSVGGLLLSKDGSTLVYGVNGRVTIPHGVTQIGDDAFSGRNELTSVTIPSSVTHVGNRAFSGCSGLLSVTIPKGVMSVGDSAFSDCRGLTSVAIPNGVTNIGDFTFSGCRELTSITIPSSVTQIGNSAFSDCRGLTSVVIPRGVTGIGDNAFEDCSGLMSVTMPSGMRRIGNDAFARCSGLTSATIPNSVTQIGDCAFKDCGRLTAITIPQGVTRIGDSAFEGCSRLTSLTIQSGAIAIGDYAFCGCRSLKAVKIPDSVTSIGAYAFDSCTGLTSVTLPAVTSIGICAFYGCDGLTLDEGDEPQPPSGIEKSYGPFVPGVAVSIDVPALVGYAAKGLPAGLKFDAKTGRVSGAATKGNVTVDVTFTKKGAATITTQFVVGPFPVISVAVNDMVGGKVTGSGGFLAGKKTTLRATAAKGYVFAGWYMDAAFEIPFKGEVDYRTPSLPCVMGETDITLYAKFVTLDEDSAEIEVPAVEDEYAPNSAIEPIILDLSGCVSLPTVRVTGLPPGLKFTAKALDMKATKTSPAAHYEANTVYGTPTKVGVYDTTFTVTTAGKKTATKVVTFVVVDRSKDDGVLKIVANDATRGKTAGAGVYTTEKKVTLKATANKGFVFAGWYMDEWFEDPLWCDVDYRTPSMPYLTSGVDETVYAKFVPASEDEEIDLFVDGSMTTASAEDTVFNTSGELTLALELESASLPKVALTGLPAGLKFTAKTILDREGYVLADANTVYGTATKPGAYVVTAKLTNATVKKAIERRFTIVVDNLTAANGFLLVTDADGVEAELRNERGEKYTVYAGVAEHGFPSIKTYYEADKVTLSGLPTGLRYDAKTGKVVGVATKAGTYTVTVTVRSGRESFVSTFTVEVVALPEWAIGTFTGAGEHYGMEGYAFFEDNLYGTVTVAANGKVSGKFLFDTDDDRLLTATFSTPSLTGYDADMEAYYCDVKVVFKDGRRVAEDQTRRLYIKPTIYDDMADTQVIGNIFVLDDEFAIDLFQNVWKLKGFWDLPSFVGRKAVTSLTLDIHGDPEIEDGTSTLTLEISPKGMVSATLVDQGLDEGKPFRERAVAKGDLLIVRREWDCYIARVALVFGNAVLIAVEVEMRVSDDGLVYYDGCEITDCTDFADWSD